MDDHTQPSRRRARDLDPSEEGLAGLFGGLERHDAPGAVRRAVRQAVRAAARPAPSGRLLRFPFGAWGLASAALLLLALGAAVTVELSDPASGPPEPPQAQAGIDALTIVEDTRMALFHKLETFDDVGLAPGRLIADWGR